MIEKKNNTEKNQIVIKYSRYSIFTPIFILFLINLALSIILGVFISKDFIFPLNFIFVPIFLYAFIYSIGNYVRFAKFKLDLKKISLSLHKIIYFEVEISNISEIIITKNSVEKKAVLFSPKNTFEGHAIQFLGHELNETINLWCCGFNEKKQNLISDSLIKIGENLNKKIRIIDDRSTIIKRGDNPCEGIKDFVDYVKALPKSYEFRKTQGVIGLLLLITGGIMLIPLILEIFLYRLILTTTLVEMLSYSGVMLVVIGFFLIMKYTKARKNKQLRKSEKPLDWKDKLT